MQTPYEKYINKRTQNRKKYFEMDGYYKLSNIAELDTYNYQYYRDRCIIRFMITGKRTEWDSDLTEIMKTHRDNPNVNWRAIYNYLDEQIKSVPENEQLLFSDVFDVNEQLKPYKNKVLSVYTGF